MKQVVLVFLGIDLFLFIVAYLFTDKVWLVNSQIAFISSSSIMLASMYSYQSMVKKGIEAGAVTDDGRDTLDKLEDPYDLYDEQNELSDNKVEERELVDVVKEERANLKKSKRSIWETTKDAKASFSFYRLSAYSVLVLGFFYLNSNGLLALIPYLVFLSLPPILMVYVLLRNR
ncbi:MAG: Unknown protein [uncultured Sulfurovum sp.]|uniref:Uncharacterized protein n=1 Tax=uncultured Sulfurovum sp. TaxID=269237 RepID=A0A6S6SK21_9BACT|nr:MAG: Unknown protein [uncultured Sulfurovum sp.]